MRNGGGGGGGGGEKEENLKFCLSLCVCAYKFVSESSPSNLQYP